MWNISYISLYFIVYSMTNKYIQYAACESKEII